MANRILLAITIVSIILGAGILTRGHIWGDDFASYIMQAESILNGTTERFIEQNSFTILESDSVKSIGPIAYPWGYPLILVPVYALKGMHPLALKLPSVVFFAGFLVSLFLLAKDRLGQAESLLLVALFAFNPLLIQFLDEIVSDIPFLFFSMLSLWLITRSDHRSLSQNIVIGASIYAAVFIRTAGILLLASFLFVEFLRWGSHSKDRTTSRRIVLDSFLVCFSFILLWGMGSVLFPDGSGSYLSQFAGMSVETFKENAIQYFNVFGQFLGEEPAWSYLFYGLLPFFLAGVWRQWRDDLIYVIFFVSWLVVHIAYPSWQGPRYVFPLLPIFMYFVFQGMKFAIGQLPDRTARFGLWAFYGLWSTLAVLFLFQSSSLAYTNLRNGRQINGPFDPFSREVYDYIQEETPSNSVVVFFKPRAMRLMTGHDSIMSLECTGILKGDILVLSTKVGPNQQIPPEEIGACNLPLNEVLENNRFIVYEIQK